MVPQQPVEARACLTDRFWRGSRGSDPVAGTTPPASTQYRGPSHRRRHGLEHLIATVVRSRTVVATPAEVWAVLADFDRIADWAPSVGHSEAMSEPPVAVGSARRVQVGRLTLVETIVEWEPQQAIAYTLDGLPPFVARATNRWALEPAGPERTTVTLTADITPGPKPPMRLAAAVLSRVIARGNDQLLDGLTAAVTTTTEGRPR